MGLRANHRVRQCALQGTQRPIAARGEVKLMPPDIRQIAMLLIINMLENFGALGELLERSNLSGRCTVNFPKGLTGRKGDASAERKQGGPAR